MSLSAFCFADGDKNVLRGPVNDKLTVGARKPDNCANPAVLRAFEPKNVVSIHVYKLVALTDVGKR
jgi:hypothetical protein